MVSAKEQLIAAVDTPKPSRTAEVHALPIACEIAARPGPTASPRGGGGRIGGRLRYLSPAPHLARGAR
jgi:hypothetical protein